MASTKEYLDFSLEQLSGLDEISRWAIFMGEMVAKYADYRDSNYSSGNR